MMRRVIDAFMRMVRGRLPERDEEFISIFNARDLKEYAERALAYERRWYPERFK